MKRRTPKWKKELDQWKKDREQAERAIRQLTNEQLIALDPPAMSELLRRERMLRAARERARSMQRRKTQEEWESTFMDLFGGNRGSTKR